MLPEPPRWVGSLPPLNLTALPRGLHSCTLHRYRLVLFGVLGVRLIPQLDRELHNDQGIFVAQSRLIISVG